MRVTYLLDITLPQGVTYKEMMVYIKEALDHHRDNIKVKDPINNLTTSTINVELFEIISKRQRILKFPGEIS